MVMIARGNSRQLNRRKVEGPAPNLPRSNAMSPVADDFDQCMDLANQVIALRNQLRRLGWNTDSPQANEVRRQMIALSLQMDDLGCPPVPVHDTPPPSVSPKIVDVEQTQAIQYFPFNGQGSGNGTKNSVPLIENKRTLLRVYINSYTNDNITGRLNFDSNLAQGQQTIIYPANVTIQGQLQAVIRRNEINHTLNFIIPPNLCTNQLRAFSIYIGLGSDPTNFRATPESPWSDTLQFRFLKPLRVHGILVHYTGPDRSGTVRDFGTPTESDFYSMMD